MASVAIPMVAGFAAQKLATDVLGVDPKMAAVLGMAAGGGASAWQAGGGSLGSIFGSQAGSAATPSIGQNMFGQTAGMAGMSPKVGGGLISAAGTTGGAVNPSTFTGFNQPMSAAYNSPQTFTGVNAPFSSMASGNGYAGTPYSPIDNSFNPYLGPNVGNADAPADLFQTNASTNFRPNPYIGANVGNADAPADLFQTNAPILQMDTQMNTQMPNFSGPQMNPQMNTEINPQMFAPNVGADRMGQTNYVYPNNSNAYNTSNISNSGRSMYNRSGYPVDPALRRNYGVPKYGQERLGEVPIDPNDLNYQADEDMYTAQLFRDGNTVSGSGVAGDIPDFINEDALRLAEMRGGQLDTLGYERATASLNSPTTPPQYPEYDAYTRATHGMDGYVMNEYDMMAREPIANFPQVDQAIANTMPNPYNPGPAEATGTPPIDPVSNETVRKKSDEIQKEVEELSEDKPSWWDKAENQQFLMQAASILLSDDIEEQQVSSGGGGGGPPSPGVYSGGSSPAPKVVFGMGPYNGQGQRGYNPREIV